MTVVLITKGMLPVKKLCFDKSLVHQSIFMGSYEVEVNPATPQLLGIMLDFKRQSFYLPACAVLDKIELVVDLYSCI